MSEPHGRILQDFQTASKRPVRWAVDAPIIGDFDDRETTIEIFDVQDLQQKKMFLDLGPVRRSASDLLGRSVRVLFHTPQATTRYYADVRPPNYRVPLTLVVSTPVRRKGVVDDDVLGDSRPPRSNSKAG